MFFEKYSVITTSKCHTNGLMIIWDKNQLQDYWVFWTFPSSGILETRKHDVSETGSVSVLKVKGGNKTPNQLGPLERDKDMKGERKVRKG
jgi:hypothetical protein